MEAQITSLTNSINSNGATGDGNFSSSNHDALQKSIDAAKAQLKTFSDFVNDDNNKTNGDVVDSSNCIGRLQALIDKAQGAYDTQSKQKDSETVAAEKAAEAKRIADYKANHPSGLAEVAIQMMLQIKQLHGILKENHIQLFLRNGKIRINNFIIINMYLIIKLEML